MIKAECVINVYIVLTDLLDQSCVRKSDDPLELKCFLVVTTNLLRNVHVYWLICDAIFVLII